MLAEAEVVKVDLVVLADKVELEVLEVLERILYLEVIDNNIVLDRNMSLLHLHMIYV